MPTVATVNIRGPQGEQGIQGIQGEVGPQGPQGEQGPAGGIEWAKATDYDGSHAATEVAHNSISIGYNAVTRGTGNVSIGNNSGEHWTNPDGAYNITIGNGAIAWGNDSVRIGSNGSVYGNAVSIGSGTMAQQGGVAIGYSTNAGGTDGVAIGYNATITSSGGVAIGCAAQAQWNAVSVGYNAQAVSDYTTAIGAYAANTSDYSTLIKSGTLEVYFISHQSSLSSQYLDGESGIRIKDDYQDTYKKFSELLSGGGGGGGDTTSSFSWGDYYNYERKYKDCYYTSQMSDINSQWRKDLTENGEWNYVLENMSEGYPDFKRWYSDYSSDYGTLRSFNSYMGQISDLDASFYYCQELESWNCGTPRCTTMYSTFQGCTKLKHFRGDLRNLQTATNMFGSWSGDCTQLDLASVQHIANVINPSGNGNTIYIGVSNTLNGSSELETALQQIRNKNWTVEVYYSDNG